MQLTIIQNIKTQTLTLEKLQQDTVCFPLNNETVFKTVVNFLLRQLGASSTQTSD